VQTRDRIQVRSEGLEPIDDLQQREVRPLGDPAAPRSADPGGQRLPTMVQQPQQLADESGQPRTGLAVYTGRNVGIIQHDLLVRPTLQDPHQPGVGESVAVVPLQQEAQIEGADFHRGLRLLRPRMIVAHLFDMTAVTQGGVGRLRASGLHQSRLTQGRAK